MGYLTGKERLALIKVTMVTTKKMVLVRILLHCKKWKCAFLLDLTYCSFNLV